MTSGQCTMGANTKVKVWRPVESVSPSPTTSARSNLQPKNCSIMANVLAFPTTVTPG